MEKLGIEPALLIAQLINFGVFFFVFSKYIAKPLVKTIKAEKSKEAERERLLADAQKREAKLAEDEVSLRQTVRKERDQLVKEAKKVGEEVKASIVSDAKKEADDIIAKAHKQIEQEKAEMYAELKDKTLELSLSIVMKAMKDYLTPDVQRKLTAHIVENMSKDVLR
ncbi:ATP synthase F0 subunit B [Candidatus Roizmanbacteria bacterium]|nr:ATP synthase F0 subunit B [Candidatus Roizmanbacteria bacterium]